jgi:toxin CptA
MHYPFSFKSSRIQQGFVFGFGCLCVTSLWFWPSIDNVLYLGIRVLTGLIILSVFAYQCYRLTQWCWDIRLDSAGAGELRQCLALESQSFVQDKPAIVTPVMCVLFLTLTSEQAKDKGRSNKRVLAVFVDMLNDTDYRHLCRILSQPVIR